MSLDTTIKNVGDYYAAHYLADKNGFAKDIADKPPPEKTRLLFSNEKTAGIE